jgi:hypothetical protein
MENQFARLLQRLSGWPAPWRHAVAATLAAEYASGLLVGQHVPDSAIVVVKTIHVDLRKSNKGSIRATATITPDNARAIGLEPKGTLQVPITIEDEQGGLSDATHPPSL